MRPAASSRSRLAPPVRRRTLELLTLLAAAWLAGSCQHAPQSAEPAAAGPAATGQLPPPAATVARMEARPRWWNYYQRSLQYALAGDWQRAAWDLEIALGRRRGALFGEDQEMRRVKTYGLHYLDDYFPHRELGICLFHLGQLEAAEQELLTSLQMLPSSRARFYLNAVRHGRLQSAPAPPASPFRIDLVSPGETFLTNRLQVDLRGTIASPAFVARVRVNGKPLFVELAVVEYALAESVPVVPGEQQIVVDAEDLQGRRARASRRVIVDLNGPEIAVTRPAAGGPGEAVVAITDDRELAAVEVDGRALILTPGQTSVSSRIVLGKRAGVAVIAVDRAGNRTVLASTAVSREQAAAAAAATDWLLAGRAGASSLRHERAEPVLLAQAAPPADAGPGASAAGGAAPPDTLPPVLRLSPRVEGRIVLTTDVFVLDLQIEDSGGVAAVTFAVDGRQETREFQPADADVRRLTRSVQLSPGLNEIVITARDRAGNPASLKLLVERRQDRAWREDLRVTSQLMPPTSAVTPPAAPTVDIYPLMIGAFTQQPARLNLVERDPAVMQRLIAEHGLSNSSLADKTLAIRTGKLRTADWCLVSRVTVWPGKDNFDLLLEVVDVATTEILLTTDIHFASADREHLRFQLRGLVAKLEQQLPRLTAPVATRAGKTLVLPVGSEHQILRGMCVLFVPADADPADYPEPVTWRGGTWVQGRVTAVRKGSCRVRVEPADAIGLLKPKDIALFR